MGTVFLELDNNIPVVLELLVEYMIPNEKEENN